MCTTIATERETPARERLGWLGRAKEVFMPLQRESSRLDSVTNRKPVTCPDLTSDLSYCPPPISSFERKSQEDSNLIVGSKETSAQVIEGIQHFEFAEAPPNMEDVRK